MPAKSKKVVENKTATEQVTAVEVKPVESKPAEVPAPVEQPKKASPKTPKPKKQKVEKPAEPQTVEAPAPAQSAPEQKPTPAKKGGKTKSKSVTKKTKKVAAKKVKTATKKTLKKTGKKVKVVKKKPTTPEIKLSEENRKRFFKLLFGDDENASGRFSGKKPKQAANKAYTSIVKTLEKDGKPFIGVDTQFSLKECTRWNKKKCRKDDNGVKEDKIYHYVGRRELLPEEVVVDHVQMKDVPADILKAGKVLSEKTMTGGGSKSYLEGKVGDFRKFVTLKNKNDADKLKLVVKKSSDGKFDLINEIVYKHTNRVSKFKPEPSN